MHNRGGYTDHPTALDFLYRSSLLFTQRFLNFCSQANCKADPNSLLIPADIYEAEDDDEGNSSNLIIVESLFDIDHVLSKLDTSTNDEPFSTNPAAFVGGYVAKRLFTKKASCEMCKSLLLSDKTITQANFFLQLKEFDFVKMGLHYPSTEFTNTIVQFGEIFNNIFQESSKNPSIAENILMCIREVDHAWFNCPDHAESSWEWLTKFYVKMMVYNKIKYQNAQKPNKTKAKKKLKKLK